MTKLEIELKELKDDVLDMMNLVQSQVSNSRKALLARDADLAEEVFAKDKKVNAADLTIDKQAERLLALYNPVAVDLRFIMACLQINTFLERVGDNAKAIAAYVHEFKAKANNKFLSDIRIEKMFDQVEEMIQLAITSFNNEDSELARKLFKKDKKLNEINSAASEITVDYLSKDQANGKDYLFYLSVIRKLERTGDMTKNLAEETIYYLDAKVLKHKNKKAASK